MRKIYEIVPTNPVKLTDLQLNNSYFSFITSMINRKIGSNQNYNAILILFALLFLQLNSFCQDSTRVLPEIEVQAYRYNRPANDVPVSIGILREGDLARFDNYSILPVVNALPGVRMEERSPGSYRFSIRGSLIRSPFGVRNVKIYWNGLPLTDGGGNTYLNLLDLSSLGKTEIIKGPGGSLYGAGTGGVVLFNSRVPRESNIEVSTGLASYGGQRLQLGGQLAESNLKGNVNYAHQESNGYRNHTAFKRDAVNMDWAYALNTKTVLSANAFYADVFYETPGGLTLSQFEEDAKQARPAGGPNKSAEEQNASVRNKSGFAGITVDKDFSDRWSGKIGVFGTYSDFENFAISNYEHRFETNAGTRIESQYSFGKEKLTGRISFGGEYQYFISPISVYKNNSGSIGERNLSDEITSTQFFMFLQAELNFPGDIFLTVAGSENFLEYNFERLFPEVEKIDKSFDGVLSPRIALLKKFGAGLSVYGSVSAGFSPPTVAEVRPSANTFNPALAPERGVNYELGFKGKLSKFSYEIAGYVFHLKETIVLQRVIDGSEYFFNAGKTDQRGVEATASYAPNAVLKIWSSYNYNHYRFDNYIKDGVDLSGNKLTGVAPTTATLGLDVNLKNGLYINQTNSYTDHIPLNDANDEFSKEFFVANVRVGWKKSWNEKIELEVYAGMNNIFDETYSLGNDLNAFGRRYYNVAPGRNYFGGLRVRNIFRKK